MASVSFLTSLLQLMEEAWTTQRASMASARTGTAQVLVLWRCPSVPPRIHQHVLVSYLLGVAGDGMGWDRMGRG